MPIANTEAAAHRHGYTRPVYIEGDVTGFAALVRPDVDFDDEFRCFDTDSQEWLTVAGWLIDNVEELECVA